MLAHRARRDKKSALAVRRGEIWLRCPNQRKVRDEGGVEYEAPASLFAVDFYFFDRHGTV